MTAPRILRGAGPVTSWTTPAQAIGLEYALDLRSNSADAGTLTRAIVALVDDAIDNAVAQLRTELDEQLAHKVDIDDAVDEGVQLEIDHEALREYAREVLASHVELFHPTAQVVDTRGLT